ncbi:phytanoyl-CoA dioxygenase family protein [Dongia deserti]|uniref:phytanoyl-CoA dioxygenase family protein n=1 Tax=Dongia deserti TaxID=2268030 RepID=UPI000E64B30C|nr:phytanoyl-CoA dioxygenase family protein [Dongia deserti]
MHQAGLTDADVRDFIENGFLRIERAFPPALAAAARAILWRDTGCDPDDTRTWTRPVVRLGEYAGPPFADAINTPVLRDAFDQLVGKGCWVPRWSLGTFPIRFPSPDDPGDTGWHIDASFAGEGSSPTDYLSWHANVSSRGRALLMLLLFSDVGDDDAPTRIRVGSHRDIARRLTPFGEQGASLKELAGNGFAESAQRPEALATGEAGTVYLCHPFLVHAAQPHRGTQPRFMAQPPLFPAEPLRLNRPDGAYSPVEQAIRLALTEVT